MLDYIKEIFALSPTLAWTVVLVLAAMTFMAVIWEQLRWWWLNTWMKFPLIGRIARLSKNHNTETNNKAWYKSEKALCSVYQKHIQIMDEHDFNEKVDYLVLAGDNGRTNMPKSLWLAIVFIVFLEAMGFSYVLAGYTIPGASENLQQAGAYGIAALISVLLVALTHFAGHELYRTGKINEARAKWQNNNRSTTLGTQIVPLAKPQSLDKDQPDYSRMINRIGSTKPSLNITIATVFFIAVIAIGATYVRGKVLEKMLHDDIVGKTEQVQNNDALASDGLDLSADVQLPAADLAQDNAAQTQAINEEADIDSKGGWGTFIILAVLFVFLQLLGILFGYKWGFAGQNSKAAHKALGSGKFSTYSEVMDYYHYIADTAQAMLEDLQQRMMERNSEVGTQGIHTTKTFRDFMSEYRDNRSADNQNRKRQPNDQTTVAIDKTEEKTNTTDLDSILNNIEAITDKTLKMQHIQSLPVEIQGKVVAELKARKANAEKLKSELEGLF